MAQEMGENQKKSHIDVSQLMWAVNVTSQYVFKSTCLTKALSAQIIMEQHGYHPTLRIGVIKDEEFEAHAWLEYDGEVILGDSEKEYVPLLDFK